jgi:hypothetical protein
VAFLPSLQYCGLLLPVVQMLYISINSCSLNTITQTKFMNRHMCHKVRQDRLRKPALLLKPQASTPHSVYIRELCSHHCSVSNLCSTYISTGSEPGFRTGHAVSNWLSPYSYPLKSIANQTSLRSYFGHVSLSIFQILCEAKAEIHIKMIRSITPEMSELVSPQHQTRVHV